MSKKYYIAYGSNLNIKQMKARCSNARIVGTSVIENYELLFKGSKSGSYLTIEKKNGANVPVAVWEVDKLDELSLDRYEGYPSFYYKKALTLPIKLKGSSKTEILDCFVYIMHEDRPLGVPSLYYVSTCLEGYISFGFDEHYLAEAQIKAEEACKNVKRYF